MKQKKKIFVQHLYHEIEDVERAEDYLDSSLPLVGLIVMYFNGLEKSLDSIICEIFTDRSDSTGLIVLHKMAYEIYLKDLVTISILDVRSKLKVTQN